MVREAHRWPSREDLQQHDPKRVHVRFRPEHARLLILRVDVAESPGSSSHVALSDAVGNWGRDESAQAHVAYLADEVSVEKDVRGLEVAVDEGFGPGFVEEVEGCGDFSGDSETGGPWEGRGPVFAVETVLEAAVFHVLVDEAAVVGAGAEEDDHVWVAHPAQDLHLYEKAVCEEVELPDESETGCGSITSNETSEGKLIMSETSLDSDME